MGYFCADLLSELHYEEREAVQLLRMHYMNRLAPMEEVKNEKPNGRKNDPNVTKFTPNERERRR